MKLAIELIVSGMTCEHCERAVSQALTAVAGVEKVVRVDRASGAVSVEGSPVPTDLVAAIVEEGYEAELRE